MFIMRSSLATLLFGNTVIGAVVRNAILPTIVISGDISSTDSQSTITSSYSNSNPSMVTVTITSTEPYVVSSKTSSMSMDAGFLCREFGICEPFATSIPDQTTLLASSTVINTTTHSASSLPSQAPQSASSKLLIPTLASSSSSNSPISSIFASTSNTATSSSDDCSFTGGCGSLMGGLSDTPPPTLVSFMPTIASQSIVATWTGTLGGASVVTFDIVASPSTVAPKASTPGLSSAPVSSFESLASQNASITSFPPGYGPRTTSYSTVSSESLMSWSALTGSGSTSISDLINTSTVSMSQESTSVRWTSLSVTGMSVVSMVPTWSSEAPTQTTSLFSSNIIDPSTAITISSFILQSQSSVSTTPPTITSKMCFGPECSSMSAWPDPAGCPIESQSWSASPTVLPVGPPVLPLTAHHPHAPSPDQTLPLGLPLSGPDNDNGLAISSSTTEITVVESHSETEYVTSDDEGDGVNEEQSPEDGESQTLPEIKHSRPCGKTLSLANHTTGLVAGNPHENVVAMALYLGTFKKILMGAYSLWKALPEDQRDSLKSGVADFVAGWVAKAKAAESKKKEAGHSSTSRDALALHGSINKLGNHSSETQACGPEDDHCFNIETLRNIYSLVAMRVPTTTVVDVISTTLQTVTTAPSIVWVTTIVTDGVVVPGSIAKASETRSSQVGYSGAWVKASLVTASTSVAQVDSSTPIFGSYTLIDPVHNLTLVTNWTTPYGGSPSTSSILDSSTLATSTSPASNNLEPSISDMTSMTPASISSTPSETTATGMMSGTSSMTTGIEGLTGGITSNIGKNSAPRGHVVVSSWYHVVAACSATIACLSLALLL